MNGISTVWMLFRLLYRVSSRITNTFQFWTLSWSSSSGLKASLYTCIYRNLRDHLNRLVTADAKHFYIHFFLVQNILKRIPMHCLHDFISVSYTDSGARSMCVFNGLVFFFQYFSHCKCSVERKYMLVGYYFVFNVH